MIMNKENKFNKIFSKKMLIVSVFLLLVLGISGCSTDSPKDEIEGNGSEQTETDTKEPEETEDNTNIYYDNLDPELKDIYNDFADITGEKKIISLTLVDDFDSNVEDDMYIYLQLQFEAEDKSDKELIKTAILEENKEIFKELSNLKEYSAITTDSLVPLENKQGHEVNNPVIVMKLNRDTLDNIQWGDFSIDDFKEVADHYREDPLLIEEWYFKHT